MIIFKCKCYLWAAQAEDEPLYPIVPGCELLVDFLKMEPDCNFTLMPQVGKLR